MASFRKIFKGFISSLQVDPKYTRIFILHERIKCYFSKIYIVNRKLYQVKATQSITEGIVKKIES
jgi:hypothetical protein